MGKRSIKKGSTGSEKTAASDGLVAVAVCRSVDEAMGAENDLWRQYPYFR
ncbi:MAG: hypothetical protein V4451_14555 [Pseudomonadota bacterium]